MKNSAAIARDRFDLGSLEGVRPQGLSPRWAEASAGPQGLSPQLLWGAAVIGELLAAAALLASGSVPAVLVRSLQLFLRF